MIDRGQILSIRSFSGKYNGKPLSISGELPLLDPNIPVRGPLTVDSAELMLNVKEYFYGMHPRLRGVSDHSLFALKASIE